MPVITKTVTGSVSSLTGLRNTALNMAKSMAEAVSTTYRELAVATKGYTNEKYYYVPMDSIGYEGWVVYFYCYTASSYHYMFFGIRKANKLDGTPDLNDENFIETNINSSAAISNNISDVPETCVMIFDESKDTVEFDIHHGSTLHGTDISDQRNNRNWMIKCTAFFAKDTNGGVLCGIGTDSIKRIRTNSTKTWVTSDEKWFNMYPQLSKNFSGVLHLTKMINYLDPSYPEMKSAYISVIRPDVLESETKKRVSFYKTNGVNWGSVGNIKWRSGYQAHTHYFPFDPFVKY